MKATKPGGIGSLESILVLLKSLKILAQDAARKSTMKDLNNRLVGYIEKVNVVKNYYCSTVQYFDSFFYQEDERLCILDVHKAFSSLAFFF
jgi:hypothetical protein